MSNEVYPRKRKPGHLTGECPQRSHHKTRWIELLTSNVNNTPEDKKTEAIEAAKALNKLADFENDLESAIMVVGVTKDRFYRWMSNGKFTDKLLQMAPLLSAKCLADVCAMADGAEKGNEVRLKANMELIRAFMPIVSREIDFDSNTRRQRLANQGYLAGKVLTMKDQLAIMAKDPFTDYAAEITKLKEEPLLIEDGAESTDKAE